MQKWVLKIVLLILVGMMFRPSSLHAESAVAEDSLQVSLLTCGPGKNVYELYGHTALRVRHLQRGTDWVFNYGMFDFDAPNFVWRFIKGHTDYTLGVCPYDVFVAMYAREGRFVDEQVLGLKPEEETRLLAALMSNWQQEGWTYRYNFLNDNCTTRAIAMVAQAVGGKISWPSVAADKAHTQRELLHQYAAKQSPWTCFAQDLMLGYEVDAPAGTSELMFSPLYAEDFLDQAMVVESSSGRVRPLVTQRHRVATPIAQEANSSIVITPMAAMLMVLACSMLIAGYERRQRCVVRMFDYVLMGILGLVGCIIAMLFFASEHPAVGSNLLIVLLNPLHLLFLPVKIWCDRKGRSSGYEWLLALQLLAFFCVAVASKQNFPPEIYVLALILLIRWWRNKPKALNRRFGWLEVCLAKLKMEK